MGFVLSIIGVMVFSSLAVWQVHRAQEKQALQDRIESRQNLPPLELRQYDASLIEDAYTPVIAKGYFDATHEILIDNEMHDGKPGYHVMTPLILEDNSAILVNRGWVAIGQSRDILPVIETPVEAIEVSGRLAPPKSKPALVLADDKNQGKVWLFLDMQKYENMTGLKLMPVIIQMDARAQNGFVRQWPDYDAKVGMHIGYAIHWFVFAVAAIVIYFSVNTKKISET